MGLFGSKTTGEVKLSGPKDIPEPVKKYLVAQKKDAGQLGDLKSVMAPSGKDDEFKIRIFSDTDVQVKEIPVKDYTTLDAHPDMVYFEGTCDKKGKNITLVAKKELKPKPKVPVFTEAEILAKINELKAPGSTVFFYLGGSPAYGGPLGRGAAVVELNPQFPGPKQKKYAMYVSNVDGLDPVAKRQKIFDSDNPKQIANWIKGNHHEPLY